jgi:hypothetical protein
MLWRTRCSTPLWGGVYISGGWLPYQRDALWCRSFYFLTPFIYQHPLPISTPSHHRIDIDFDFNLSSIAIFEFIPFNHGVALARRDNSTNGLGRYAMARGFGTPRSSLGTCGSAGSESRRKGRERKAQWIFVCIAIHVSFYIPHSDGALLRSKAEMPLVLGLAGKFTDQLLSLSDQNRDLKNPNSPSSRFERRISSYKKAVTSACMRNENDVRNQSRDTIC